MQAEWGPELESEEKQQLAHVIVQNSYAKTLEKQNNSRYLNKKQVSMMQSINKVEQELFNNPWKPVLQPESKSVAQFRLMNDMRKISKGSNSARSFVGIDSFSDDGVSVSQEDSQFGDRQKSQQMRDHEELKRKFLQINEQLGLKNKTGSLDGGIVNGGFFDEIIESQFEIDHLSAYKKQSEFED